MQVVLATGNRGKAAELREALAPLEWQLLTLEDLGGLQLPQETGNTYEDNAALKACFAALKLGLPALADDSGLEVRALGGQPGIYSARFGDKRTDLERNVFLLESMRGAEDRSATFVSVLVLAYPDGGLETYRGEVSGTILEGPRGSGGFGYDSLFLVPGLGKTMAELSREEKRRISHRGLALDQLLAHHLSSHQAPLP
jgi:XTP/dITP diphosphohydrolase